MGKEKFESRGLGGREALVEEIKAKAGELDDLLVQIETPIGSFVTGTDIAVAIQRPGECKRLVAMARTSLENAVMQAVKAVSRGQ